MIDKVNVPVGCVPRAGFGIKAGFKVYKFGWWHHPTTVSSPISIGFDEYRQGRAADGADFDDVHPSRAPQPK